MISPKSDLSRDAVCSCSAAVAPDPASADPEAKYYPTAHDDDGAAGGSICVPSYAQQCVSASLMMSKHEAFSVDCVACDLQHGQFSSLTVTG